MEIKNYTPDLELRGYVKNVPGDVYRSQPGVSKSALDKLNKSPAHYKLRDTFNPTDAMRIGTAVHAAVLEPDVFEREYKLHPEVPDRRVKAYKDLAAEFGEDFVLVGKTASLVLELRDAVLSDPYAGKVFRTDGWSELSGFTHDPVSGMAVKHRFDRVTAYGGAIDLKVTDAVTEDEFSRKIQSFRYHVQASFYADQYEWITGNKLKSFTFVACEPSPPYTVRMFVLDENDIEAGRREYRKNLDTLQDCMSRQHWPKLSSEPVIVTRPAWAIRREYEQ